MNPHLPTVGTEPDNVPQSDEHPNQITTQNQRSTPNPQSEFNTPNQLKQPDTPNTIEHLNPNVSMPDTIPAVIPVSNPSPERVKNDLQVVNKVLDFESLPVEKKSNLDLYDHAKTNAKTNITEKLKNINDTSSENIN